MKIDSYQYVEKYVRQRGVSEYALVIDSAYERCEHKQLEGGRGCR